MNTFAHRAISASAGTGKTWALTHRYLALLAAGESPDRICALTFSRKAAGEIFDSIVERLCVSAVNDRERTVTADNIDAQTPAAAAPRAARAYVTLLRRLLDQAHRLRVGTLDSFILGIARAFPLELGLPPDVQPMDNAGGEAQAARQALLMRIIDPRHHKNDGGIAAKALLQAVRQAGFGRETKSLAGKLDANISAMHDFYREHSGKAWGDAKRIWPTGRWWENVVQAELETARTDAYHEALRQAFGTISRPAQLGDACAKIAAAAANHAPDQPWPANLSNTVLAQLLEWLPDGAPGLTLVFYKKEYIIPDNLHPPLRAALGNLVGVEVQRSLETTAGLHALLNRYDALYNEAQRVDGRLSFDDFARQLGCEDNLPSMEPDKRLYIDYRMDGRLDHWLLDEFQDTSDTQWQAIANLVDEVVQDSDKQRSFFYVGDIKQSIYGWRGGNYRLFGHVRDRYRIGTGDSLNVCYRSLPEIIDTVNTVFDKLDRWIPSGGEAKGPHPQAVKQFMMEWQEHESARQGEGYAALLEYEPKSKTNPADNNADGENNENDPAQYEAIVNVLAEVMPTQTNLSAAVLVRDNKQGRVCADVLRRRLEGVPVVHEGTGGIVDNPVVTLLLALVRYCAHPADKLALRHLQMSPWAAAATTAADFMGDRLKDLPRRFLEQVHESGFAGALREWGNRLMAAGVNDAFGRQRLNALLAAAESFDATGARDCDAFGDAIRAHQVKSEAAAGAIRVMTIHQCKGLGFDMVLAPFDPMAKGFGNVSGIEMLRSDCGKVSPTDDGWVLKRPKNEILPATGGAAVKALDEARAGENFSQLCVLYVALTRAKQALYMFVPKTSKSSTTVREADLLRERLTDSFRTAGSSRNGLTALYEKGRPDWFTRMPVKPAGTEVSQAADTRPVSVGCVVEPARREPSKDHAEGQLFPAAYSFGRESGDVRNFGSAIHRLLERIEWIEDADMDAVIADWRAESTEPASLLNDVATQFRNCVKAATVRAVLNRPADAVHAEVWRETPFDYVRESAGGKEILTGRFDRLIIECDEKHRPVRATVVDFKSNRVSDIAAMHKTADGYRGQMQDYAAAAARLLGLPRQAVKAVLLFTRLAEAHVMD